MQPNTPPRYLDSYRQREIRFICHQANRGESLCLVGIAGSGKSNLINFLRDDDVAKRQYLGDNTAQVHFPDVDATGWDGTADSLWRAMLDALTRVAHPTLPSAEPSSTDPLHRLENAVERICQQDGHRVMFLLDEFDDILRKGPSSVFEQFSRLRSAGNRERLSYLVFTRKLPHVLGREHGLETHSKFYDLLRYNIYALPLHNRDDSLQMLIHLNAVDGAPFSNDKLDRIRQLSGGHSRLIKITFEVCKRGASEQDIFDHRLVREPEIQDECKRILSGLHRQERDVAIRVARRRSQPPDEPTIDHLHRRGLITANGEWFSPLMEAFLRDYLE